MSSIMYSQRAGKPRTYLSEVCEASPCKTDVSGLVSDYRLYIQGRHWNSGATKDAIATLLVNCCISLMQLATILKSIVL